MAFDGSGNFIRLHSWQQDAANGIDISAPEMDGEDNGFAAGLTLAVTRDGQGKMAADFLPGAANTYNCGSASFPWATGNFGALNVANAPVYAGAPQNLQTGASYTLVLTDANKHIYNASTGCAYTVPANSSVPFAIGTMITFVNRGAAPATIAVSTDLMYLAGVGTLGTRTLANYGMATMLKVAATLWFISGIGLS